MNEVYIFKDWTALCQVKNSMTPLRRAYASVSPDGSVIVTITEENTILVRIPVESPDVWSLTSEEAESLLNSYGFNCRFESTYHINRSARKILVSLKNLGAEMITRLSKPRGEVFASVKDSDPINLKTCEGWSFEDWLFLTPGVTYSIDSLLKRGD